MTMYYIILIIYYCLRIVYFILNDLMTCRQTEKLDNSLFLNLLETEL